MINHLKIKILNRSGNPLPYYSTELSAGMDLRASIEETKILKPLERALIKTGLYIEIPPGYEAQVRPRSGLSLKQGITVLNSPGTIDADYRGEVGVILINLSGEEVEIRNGDRIAQMVVARHENVSWMEVDALEESVRGEGGFGSTGKS